MLGKTKLILRVEPQDELYLKSTFEKYFTKETGLLFRKEMNGYQGQRVKVISTIITHHKQKKPTYSIVCVPINGLKEAQRFPLICIDRSQPLIRNGKRISLKNKELYIQYLT